MRWSRRLKDRFLKAPFWAPFVIAGASRPMCLPILPDGHIFQEAIVPTDIIAPNGSPME